MSSEFILMVTTSDQKETLLRIARHLVEANLAACCQIGGPVTSIYRWDNQIAEDDEWTCTIKTRSDNFPEISRLILELHHYDQPQIVAMPIAKVESGYMDWLLENTGSSGQ